MLTLTRRAGQSIHIGDDVVITIVESKDSKVLVSIDAPREVRIRRNEVVEREEQAAAIARQIATHASDAIGAVKGRMAD